MVKPERLKKMLARMMAKLGDKAGGAWDRVSKGKLWWLVPIFFIAVAFVAVFALSSLFRSDPVVVKKQTVVKVNDQPEDHKGAYHEKKAELLEDELRTRADGDGVRDPSVLLRGSAARKKRNK